MYTETEMRELTDDELNCVSGGRPSGQTATEATVTDQIMGAVAAIPFFGTAIYAGYQFGKGINALM